MSLQIAYQAEVEAIRSGQFSHPDERHCECRGGWFLTDFDTWEECPSHRGRRHPEDADPEPFLYVDIENTDGSPYKGVIACDPDGNEVYNNGPVFAIADCPDHLEEAKRVARGWRKALDEARPRKNLKVRLHREWL